MKLFESVFEEVIVIICISVSVGGRKHETNLSIIQLYSAFVI